MSEFIDTYFQEFKQSILSHNMISGEIIIEIESHDHDIYQPQKLIQLFLLELNIKCEHFNYSISENSLDTALNSIKYGLSSKVNYTRMVRPITLGEQNKYAYEFISFFESPKFFSIDTRIYQSDLDLDDFWEVGGSIIIDKNKIGIFWINDLYSKFV